MLVLTRKVGEKIYIEGGIVITVLRLTEFNARIGIEADKETAICRYEKKDTWRTYEEKRSIDSVKKTK